jgi:GntR family transcriptional regulator, rspAB operon transcriptional repressor
MADGDGKILPAQLERRVYERLRDDIVTGVLHPGDQLVEARLASELGVSKTPVREALIRLQRDGLVQIEPYRGARVLEPSAADIREILELRELLETHVARQLAVSGHGDVLAALEETIQRGRVALERDDEAGVADALTAFSDVFADAAENVRLAEVLRGLRSVTLLIGSASMHASGRTRRSLDEHAMILRALRRGDPEAAAAATSRHVRSLEQDTLVVAPSAELAG